MTGLWFQGVYVMEKKLDTIPCPQTLLGNHRTKWWIFQQAMFDYQRVPTNYDQLCMYIRVCIYIYYTYSYDINKTRVFSRVDVRQDVSSNLWQSHMATRK